MLPGSFMLSTSPVPQRNTDLPTEPCQAMRKSAKSASPSNSIPRINPFGTTFTPSRGQPLWRVWHIRLRDRSKSVSPLIPKPLCFARPKKANIVTRGAVTFPQPLRTTGQGVTHGQSSISPPVHSRRVDRPHRRHHLPDCQSPARSRFLVHRHALLARNPDRHLPR